MVHDCVSEMNMMVERLSASKIEFLKECQQKAYRDGHDWARDHASYFELTTLVIHSSKCYPFDSVAAILRVLAMANPAHLEGQRERALEVLFPSDRRFTDEPVYSYSWVDAAITAYSDVESELPVILD